jgi:hypothetical protein
VRAIIAVPKRMRTRWIRELGLGRAPFLVGFGVHGHILGLLFDTASDSHGKSCKFCSRSGSHLF